MTSVHKVNPNADVISSKYALNVNITAAKGLMNILKSNLGPKGTLKMLVGGAGSLRITKDGATLLNQMQIQHPTAILIAKTASAQDQITGDGTTSSILFVGELLRQCEMIVQEGLHPRVLVDGIHLAREEALKFIEGYKTAVEFEDDEKTGDVSTNRDLLINVARTALRTKLHQEMADHLAEIVVDAVLAIRKPGKDVDLHMVEIIAMTQHSDMDTRLVKGLVLDHGARHPHMTKDNKDCFVLTCNIGLEWEKTEVNSGFFYSTAQQREDLVKAERASTDKKVQAIIDLKNEVVGDTDKRFILVNQHGIDPISLDLLQKAGIVGIRRAKRRNMERIPLACGGFAVNSVRDLTPECLGRAGHVYEHELNGEKFTFIEEAPNTFSCTILINGPNKYTILQIKDAIRDGLRAVRNVIRDKAVISGAASFETALHLHLLKFKDTVKGRSKLGIKAYADALLVIPKTLSLNSGLDVQDTLIKLLEESEQEPKVGLDVNTGGVLLPEDEGIFDNYAVKKQFLHLAPLIASKILLVDEIIRAGRSMKKG